jgi:thiamine-monophosphate kinase
VTRLVDVGEYGVHAWLRTALAAPAGAIAEVGDDCAFLDLVPGHWLLVTSDRLPLGLGGRYGGRLVVVQNFSDIVSKGGRPIAFLLDLYMPREASFEELQEIVLGAKHEAERHGAFVIGGDTKEDKKLTVVGVALGLVPKPHRVSRAGARPGDVVAITLARSEPLGARWAKVVADYHRPSLPASVDEALGAAYARDIAIPAAEMQAAVATGLVSAAIDNSDGTGGSLEILARASGVGFALERAGLERTIDPLAATVAAALGTDRLRFAFAPGYDWQCLLTAAPARFAEVEAAVAAAGGALVRLGVATAERAITLDGARLRPFTDEKFKAHPWEDQPRHWLEHVLAEA